MAGLPSRPTTQMLTGQYVILHHTGYGEDHFDLMLDPGDDQLLRTWRLDAYPQPTQITPLADHRRIYLTYEGPVSNDRGHVKNVAAGVYELIAEEPRSCQIRLLPSGIELTLPR